MEKARSDGKPLVYIGFGSITVPDPRLVTEHVVEAVVKSMWRFMIDRVELFIFGALGGVRAIVSRGWSSRMSRTSKGEPDVVIPEECYMVCPSLNTRFLVTYILFQVDKVPHE